MKGKPQADWFLKKTTILKEDLPPVLDVELSSSQIAKMGGESVMFREMQAWLTEVERATGKKPILYVSQRFIEKYLRHAPQKLLSYNVWIARYGEYRPYVKLLFWQLSPFGRVEGINGNVDIDVFNGNQEQFDRYVSSNYTIQP
jgi:lysozyme